MSPSVSVQTFPSRNHLALTKILFCNLKRRNFLKIFSFWCISATDWAIEYTTILFWMCNIRGIFLKNYIFVKRCCFYDTMWSVLDTYYIHSSIYPTNAKMLQNSGLWTDIKQVYKDLMVLLIAVVQLQTL